jgi:hypothetical protein
MYECEYCEREFDTQKGVKVHQGHMHDLPYDDPEVLRDLYHGEKKPLREVANELNVSFHTVIKKMDEYGIERRSHSYATFLGKLDQIPQYHTHYRGYERWRTNVKGTEYSVFVHRLQAVAEYGFEAVKDMQVHHENGIPWDNRPENLELMSRSEHTKHHHESGDLPQSA